jgi:ABC-type sulfate/molybdate transport systems ATPase subunit
MVPLDIDIVLPRRTFELRLALTLGAETIGLIGRSGAGKTSLLRAVAGLDRPSAGHITLGPEPWFDHDRGIHLAPERRRVGYLPQDYGLFPHLTVAGNVRFAGRRNRPDLLERMGIAHLASARPGQLSGGERQRVGLARALARDPGVLLLDEPFAALDTITRHQVRGDLVRLLADLELPTLLVTHSFEDAGALARRVGVIDRGRLGQLATTPDLLARPSTATVAAITGANVVDGIARPARGGAVVQLAGGGELATTSPAEGPVQVAVHPWEMAVGEPGSGAVLDTVVSAGQARGALVIRTTRFTIHSPAGQRDRPPPSHGQLVGLTVAPADVRVFPEMPCGMPA